MCESTSKIRAIRETCRNFAVFCDNIDDAFLDKVHFGADGSFFDDVVSWLEHFVLELRYHVSNEVWIGVCKKRDGRYQRSAVVVDNFLQTSKQPQLTRSSLWKCKPPQADHVICAYSLNSASQSHYLVAISKWPNEWMKQIYSALKSLQMYA